MGKRIIIANVGGKKFRAGCKTSVRYPSQMGGYINYTFISKKAAEAHLKGISSWAQNRAKITTSSPCKRVRSKKTK